MTQINLVPYTSEWSRLYAVEAEKIQDTLGNTCIAVHHVGSTAVPGLAAKPIIDMIVVVSSFENMDAVLARCGYKFKGEYNLPMRRLYGKKEPHTFHVHVHLEGSAEIALNLLFRDALRTHEEWRKRYQDIKQKAALQEDASQKSGTGVTCYNLYKNDFISAVLESQGFSGLCLRICTQKEEWSAYHHLRKTVLFDPVGKVYDPNHPSLSDPHHKHLVLIQGTQVIAAGQVEWRNLETALLRTLIVDPHHQRQGIGKNLLERLEKWVRFHGVQSIFLNANASAIPFYRQFGYEEKAFIDETRTPQTLQMGKTLI